MSIACRYTAVAAALVAGTFATSVAAQSGGPSYTYADFGYLNLDVDGQGDIDGYTARGSFAVNEQFHILADYMRVSEGQLSLTGTTIAGGFNMPMSGTTDFVARVGWVNARAKWFGVSESDDGWMMQGGIRSMVTPELELNAFLTHTDVAGSDTSIGIGAVYLFTRAFGVFGNMEFSDGDSLGSLGVRFSF